MQVLIARLRQDYKGYNRGRIANLDQNLFKLAAKTVWLSPFDQPSWAQNILRNLRVAPLNHALNCKFYSIPCSEHCFSSLMLTRHVLAISHMLSWYLILRGPEGLIDHGSYLIIWMIEWPFNSADQVCAAAPILSANSVTLDYTIINFLSTLGLRPWYFAPTASR